MKSITTLSVLVPVYNEEHLVAASLERLKCLAESPVLERVQIIVVDDGSSDQTDAAISRFKERSAAEPVEKMQWLFIRHEKNKGKAAAIHTALSAATEELTVIHDADLEYHPADLVKMVQVFLAEQADAVFGSRFMASEYRRVLFFRHQVGNRFLTLLCNVVSDLNLSDMETCYKMVRTTLLKSIPLNGKGFELEPEIAIKLAKRGARIFEVPIRYAGRTYQEGKKIGWKDGVRAVKAILRFAWSDEIYVQDKYGSQILGRLNRAPRFTAWMADTIRPYVRQKVLEIGAGTGNLTAQLIPRVVYWATDINPLYLMYLENVGRNRPYMKVGFTDAEKAESYPQDQKFDTAICLNVVEHLVNDRGALVNIRAALEDGGRAIILVPCGPGLYGTLDEVLGHQRRYTRKSLEELVTKAGFKLESMLEFNRAGVIAWWLNGRVLRRRTFGLGQIMALNLLTPVFRLIDKFLPWAPLSLIAVARKQASADLRKDAQRYTVAGSGLQELRLPTT
jgi:glycosyltransferase involved in cell wall biosynthesis/phospholipid N-methyltransferase